MSMHGDGRYRQQSKASAFAAGTCYRLDGVGDPVVLIHGVGLDQQMWVAQAEALTPRFKVLRYDLHGHGQSDPLHGEAGLSNFVTQLEALLNSLEISQCAVIGFSLGALVARGFARAYPQRISRLVLMNGVYQRSQEQREAILSRLETAQQQGPAAIIEAALDRWFSDAYRQSHPQVIQAVCDRLNNNDPQAFLSAYQIFAQADQELEGDLLQIQAPTLVMTGELDVGSTPLMAEQMASDLAQASLKIIPGQRHMMPVEAAQEVNQVLLEFLSRS